MLAVDSGRCSQTTLVVPAADRLPSDPRHTWESRKAAGSTDIAVRKVTVSSGRRFLEEVEEDIGFSFVTVSFEKEGDCPIALDASAQERLVEEALDFVGHFASVYRFVSWQVDVFAPTLFDTPAVRIGISRNYTFTDTTVGGEFTLVSQPPLVPDNPRYGVGKPRLSEAQFRELKHRVRAGERLHVSDELRLEAWELRQIHRDFRLALVIANTAFETWLQWRVLEEFRLRGVTHHPPGAAASALANVIPEENVGPLFQKYIVHLVGRDIRTEAVYIRWRADAYLPRNEVVHRGRTTVTSADVGRAMDAIAALGMFLETELTKTRPP